MTTHKRLSGLTSRLIRLLGDRIVPAAAGEGRVCILNYHRILEAADPLLDSEPDIHTFRWQMELLAECFNVIPLHDALLALDAQCVPPKAVCITFDDGYRSTHDLALPILKKFNLPATVFVTSGYIDDGCMWNDKILEAVRQYSGKQIDLRKLGLGIHSAKTFKDKKNAISRLTEVAKYLPPPKRSELTRELEKLAGDASSQGIMLTPAMIRNLDQEGIEIGAHTVSHPILTSLDDQSARLELEEGKKQLEAITGHPVRFFAYPNGKTGLDFDERHVAMAREAGFSAAFTTAFGAATKAHDRFQLPRSRPWDSTSLFFGLRLLRWLAP